MYFLVGFMGYVSTRSRLKEMRNLLKAFKTELRLTERQKDKVRRSLGICRFLANQYIARNIWVCQEFCVNRFNKQHRIAA